jgi:PIN domain nuclease of toxin-antitoxin system
MECGGRQPGLLKLLLDTNVVIRFATAPGKLSREQRPAVQSGSAQSACWRSQSSTAGGSTRIKGDLCRLIDLIDENPLCHILPVTVEIAREVAAVGGFLRDPADRAIMATACVHRLKLLTADERIGESQLVPVIS